MKLSRTFTYAVQAVRELCAAPVDQTVTCKQLAKRGGMPERFLLQILRSLVTGGLLQSNRGVHGGYRLNRKPGEISMLDVLEAVEGPVGFDSPQPLSNGEELTELSGLLGEARSRIRHSLSEIKICRGGQEDEGEDDSPREQYAVAG